MLGVKAGNWANPTSAHVGHAIGGSASTVPALPIPLILHRHPWIFCAAVIKPDSAFARSWALVAEDPLAK
jgi:hypothetical protein